MQNIPRVTANNLKTCSPGPLVWKLVLITSLTSTVGTSTIFSSKTGPQVEGDFFDEMSGRSPRHLLIDNLWHFNLDLTNMDIMSISVSFELYKETKPQVIASFSTYWTSSFSTLAEKRRNSIYIYIYIHIDICTMCMCGFYGQHPSLWPLTAVCTCVYGMRIYIYIYTQIERERERDICRIWQHGQHTFHKKSHLSTEFFQNLAPVCRGPVLLAWAPGTRYPGGWHASNINLTNGKLLCWTQSHGDGRWFSFWKVGSF